jgi:hypothetical protein
MTRNFCVTASALSLLFLIYVTGSCRGLVVTVWRPEFDVEVLMDTSVLVQVSVRVIRFFYVQIFGQCTIDLRYREGFYMKRVGIALTRVFFVVYDS